MRRKSNRKKATAKSREQIHQDSDSDEILAEARRQETLTAMVGVVLRALRLVGLQLVIEKKPRE